MFAVVLEERSNKGMMHINEALFLDSLLTYVNICLVVVPIAAILIAILFINYSTFPADISKQSLNKQGL